MALFDFFKKKKTSENNIQNQQFNQNINNRPSMPRNWEGKTTVRIAPPYTPIPVVPIGCDGRSYPPSELKEISDSPICPCESDEHYFIKSNSNTGTAVYRCNQCGLEILTPLFSKAIYEKYFGSCFDGISHKWNPYKMRAENIIDFELSYGDCPIVNVEFNGQCLKVKNKINGSRDGGNFYPAGFFDEKQIILSEEDKRELVACLQSLDLSTFTTSPDLFKKFGCPGFSISDKFVCGFSTGGRFECLSPSCDGFDKLVSVVKYIISRNDKPFTPQSQIVSNVMGWICNGCGTNNKSEYNFCEKCGTKRPW